jgi:hypothetical protein
MRCPKCQFDHEDQTTECLRCGIVFAKYSPLQEAVRPLRIPTLIEEVQEAPQSLQEAKEELRYRVLALPLALLAAGLLVRVSVGLVRIFMSMWVHETGHAVTAWLCGFRAFPGPWATLVSNTRMPLVTVAVAAGVCFCIFQSWRAGRSALVVGGVAALVAQLICTTLPITEANALVIFGGDAGCLVLGSLLMATFYVRRDSALYRFSLRWGFLVIGAAAFMDASHTWWGARGDPGLIPFGENEGFGLSDPSRLTEDYGWAMQTMVDLYVWLGVACLAFLAVLYVVGIVQARSVVRMKAKASISPSGYCLRRKTDGVR